MHMDLTWVAMLQQPSGTLASQHQGYREMHQIQNGLVAADVQVLGVKMPAAEGDVYDGSSALRNASRLSTAPA